MSKADLHVHSKYSEQLSEKFLRDLGAAESYTEPEFIYRTAKERGMDFVTITDHNRIEGALKLQEKYPQTAFTGVEATAYFPEDGCNIHMLVYGLNAREFEEIQKLRTNIYDLRDYLKIRNLAHSVAHAAYSRNDKLDVAKLEKLILLFDVFEGINGGTSRMNNSTWMNVLRHLTPARIEDLYRRHHIEPFSDTPWIKGFTGGSDDHAGLFMARTWTNAPAGTVEEFVESLKRKQTMADGRHSDFQSLAFTLYKVAYDFSKAKNRKAARSFMGKINALIFDRRRLRLRDRLLLKTLKYRNRRREDVIQGHLVDLIERCNADERMPVERRLDLVYDKIAVITDELMKLALRSFTTDLKKGDVMSIVKHLSASISGIFLSLPFIVTSRYMYKSRNLTRELNERFGISRSTGRSNMLWFADNAEANEEELGRLSAKVCGENVRPRIVTALPPSVMRRGSLAFKTVNVPSIHAFRVGEARENELRVPSVLASLKEIYRQDPEEVCIATLGPVGLLGLLTAKLLNARATALYDEGYYRKMMNMIEADTIRTAVESYTRWFYGMMDEILVPNTESMDFLEGLGLNRTKMRLYEAGTEAGSGTVGREYGISSGDAATA